MSPIVRRPLAIKPVLRIERLDAQGGWWAASGSDCCVPPHPYGVLEHDHDRTDEMIWNATGMVRGVMARRQNAVRASTSAWLPLHYEGALLKSLQRDLTGPVVLGPAVHGMRTGTRSVDVVVREASTPHRNANAVLTTWLTLAVQEAQKGLVWGGGGGLAFGPGTPTAHQMLAARAIAATLLPIAPHTARLYVAVPEG